MSDKPKRFGDTLSSGIQDVAALLPLLGTEQCERHVGSALEKGYLYASAATLSLFGILGIVKVAFATLLATITYPFYGGRWLDDVGFATPGSVSSMVTIDKDTGLYGAEVKLQKLLGEQHIDNPNMVSGFEWSGWRRTRHASYDGSEAVRRWNRRGWYEGGAHFSEYCWGAVKDVGKMNIKELGRDIKALSRRLRFRVRHMSNIFLEPLSSWNALLVLTSALSAVIGISPYIYLARHHWNSPLTWIYPALRSFGSFLCVVCIQLALQRRIHRVTNTSLAWMRISQRHDSISEDIRDGGTTMLEERIRIHLPRRQEPYGLEEGRREVLSETEQQELAALLATDPILVICQFLIAVGMTMIVAGYVGCFSIVGQAEASSDPYAWFAMRSHSHCSVFCYGG
uniref:Uncharacterized protein n=1 Tax=Moniliophthora roreri TaxID=221103 RepID=A0A0W0F978_MONRR